VIPPPIIGTGPRNYAGWVLLAALGVPLLVLVSINFFSTSFAPASKAKECVSLMESAVSADRRGGDEHGDWDSVNACVSKVAAARSKDQLTAMVYAASRHEKGLSVGISDLAVLARSKYARHRAFAKVYAQQTMSGQEAKSLIDQMPNTSFVYKLAKVHALEESGTSATTAKTRYLGNPGPTPAELVIMLATLCATMAGIGLWVVYFGLRAAGRLQPKGHPLGNLSLPDADRCALRAAQYLVLYIVVGVGVAVAAPLARALRLPPPTEAATLVLNSTLLVIGFVALSFLELDGKRLRLSDIGIARTGFLRHAAWGVGGEIANAPIMLALGLASARVFQGIPQVENPVITNARSASAPLTIALLLLGASFFAPLIEETWFRGTLLPAFSSVARSPARGILITSILFASLHPTGLPSWLPLASIGAMGAMLTYQTKSLVPAMVMHGVHNAVMLAFTLATS
jgi:membrane protease YdiL (CAAX protease family)